MMNWGRFRTQGEVGHFKTELGEMIESFYKLKRYCKDTGQCGLDVKSLLGQAESQLLDLLPQIRHFRDSLEQKIE